jgi:hypothetical protein
LILTLTNNSDSCDETIPDKRTKSLLSRRLQSQFQNQTINFYSTILSCYEHSLEKNLDPSIILLVFDKLTSKNVNCVTKESSKEYCVTNCLAKNLNEQIDYKTLALRSEKYQNKHFEAVKHELDEDLVEFFSLGKIVLIEDIHNLPADSMILVYTYGDDASTAKYRGIMVLLTYELETDISKNKEKSDELNNEYSKLSSFIETSLYDKWSKDIDYDQLRPLLTRIGNNYILVNPEQSCYRNEHDRDGV